MGNPFPRSGARECGGGVQLALRGAGGTWGAFWRAFPHAGGDGHTGLYLASLGYEVTLADLAQPMLERAAALAAERGLKVTTRQHAAGEFPDADATFDLVTCRMAAHHFSSPAAFVRETARVLRPGGVFVLTDGTVPDDEPEAEEWTHALEKLRDPSHHRFLTPREWQALCTQEKMVVEKVALTPRKQPDIDWYFETAATSPENRVAVRELVRTAPARARELFQLGEEDGRIMWWWQMLTLVARKLEVEPARGAA